MDVQFDNFQIQQLFFNDQNNLFIKFNDYFDNPLRFDVVVLSFPTQWNFQLIQEYVFSKKKQELLLDAIKEIEYYDGLIGDENSKPVAVQFCLRYIQYLYYIEKKTIKVFLNEIPANSGREQFITIV